MSLATYLGFAVSRALSLIPLLRFFSRNKKKGAQYVVVPGSLEARLFLEDLLAAHRSAIWAGVEWINTLGNRHIVCANRIEAV